MRPDPKPSALASAAGRSTEARADAQPIEPAEAAPPLDDAHDTEIDDDGLTDAELREWLQEVKSEALHASLGKPRAVPPSRRLLAAIAHAGRIAIEECRLTYALDPTWAAPERDAITVLAALIHALKRHDVDLLAVGARRYMTSIGLALRRRHRTTFLRELLARVGSVDLTNLRQKARTMLVVLYRDGPAFGVPRPRRHLLAAARELERLLERRRELADRLDRERIETDRLLVDVLIALNCTEVEAANLVRSL